MKTSIIRLNAFVLVVFSVFTSQFAFAAESAKPADSIHSKEVKPDLMIKGKKILVVFFSHSGNTREIARQIHEIVGGDIVEIKTVKPYTKDFDALVEQAGQELKSGYKPPITTKINNIKAYDMVFIGYPSWWATYPAPVKTFLNENKFRGKSIAPFCTHEGSALGNSIMDIKAMCPRAKILEGFEVRGGEVKSANKKVADWLRKIGIIK